MKQAKREAISSGDGDRVLAIDDAMDELKEKRQEAKQELKNAEEQAKTIAQPPVTIDPVLGDWMERNEWFGKDGKLTGIANGLGEAIRRENPGLVGKPFLEELDKQLEEYLPEKLGKKKTNFNPMEGQASSTSRPVSKSKKSYDNLPSEAKAACDRFVKQGLMTKEQYVSEYDWE